MIKTTLELIILIILKGKSVTISTSRKGYVDPLGAKGHRLLEKFIYTLLKK